MFFFVAACVAVIPFIFVSGSLGHVTMDVDNNGNAMTTEFDDNEKSNPFAELLYNAYHNDSKDGPLSPTIPTASTSNAGDGDDDGRAPDNPEPPGGKRKRADVSSRKKKNKEMRLTTTKCGLRGILLDDNDFRRRFTGYVDEAVLAATHISFMGSRMVNLILLDCLENNRPLPDMSDTFVRQVFGAFWKESSSGSEKFQAQFQEWFHDGTGLEELGLRDMAQASYGHVGYGQILTYLAQEYKTACYNHIKLGFCRRWFAMVRRHVLARFPFLGQKGFGAAAGGLVKVMALATMEKDFARDDLDAALVEAMAKEGYVRPRQEHMEDPWDVATTLTDMVEAWRIQFESMLPAKNNFCQSKWMKLLPWHYAMLKDAAEALDRGEKAKQWSVVPLCSWDAKFITIDTDVLHDLLRNCGVAGVPTNKKAFRAEEDRWWNLAFRVQKLRSAAGKGHECNHIIKTDGISACVSFMRPKLSTDIDWTEMEKTEAMVDDDDDGNDDTEEKTENKKKKIPWVTPLDKWPDPATVFDELVTGVDPGRRDIVSANRPSVDEHRKAAPDKRHCAPSRCTTHNGKRTKRHLNKKKKKEKKKKGRKKKRKHRHGGKRKAKWHFAGEVSFSVSMDEWRHVSGSKRSEHLRNKWLKNDLSFDNSTSLYDLTNNAPSGKVAAMAKMVRHIAYVNGILERVLDHNVKYRRVRRLRFHTYMVRTAALDSLCIRLSGGRGKDAVVVLGAAQCSSGFGYFPGPIKELRRRLELHTRVVVLDEHYTSQRCSKCAFDHSLPISDRKKKLEAGRKRDSDGKSVEIHGVRWCSNQSCNQTWNRDVNAARNMRLVFLHMLRNGKVRPEPFQHDGAQSAAYN